MVEVFYLGRFTCVFLILVIQYNELEDIEFLDGWHGRRRRFLCTNL
nr:MAG TPA: hypothetical protein [Caudoviricetes sp.]